MNESWIDKSDREIRDDIVAIAKEETGLTNLKSTGVLRGFVETIARIVQFIYRSAINPIYENASLDGATGFFLSLWGLMLGVVRKPAAKTAGLLTCAADGDGSVREGTRAAVEGTDLRFAVTETVAFSEGDVFAVPVAAERPGPEHNIGSGVPLRFTRVVKGLASVSAGDGWTTEPGHGEEDDASYRERIRSKWNGQVLGDTKEVYKFRAEEVAGVRSARVVRTPRGPGTTDVIVAAANGEPGDELLQAVRDNLHRHELMAFDVRVKAPGVCPVEVAVEYSGGAGEAEVALVAERYAADLGIGSRLRLSELYELYRPLSLKTLEVVSPARDAQPAEDAIVKATVTARRTGS